MITIGLVYEDLLGLNYLDVLQMLENKGFCNITCRDDGWNLFHRSESVKSILIEGTEGFEENDAFYENVNIVILYYS